MEKEIHGIKITTIARICIALCVILMVITYIGIAHVKDSYEELIDNTTNCIEGQKCAVTLERASDYLTDQVRLFVLNKDASHMYNYFDEVDSKNRENAVKQIRKIYRKTDPQTVEQLEGALKESNLLENSEYHAMRIVAHIMGMDESKLPDAVAQWELTEEELSMSAGELEQMAFKLVYGSEYLEAKARIESNVEDTMQLLTSGMEERQKDSGYVLERTLTEQKIYTFAMMLLVCIVFFLIGILVVHPVNDHVRSIQSNKQWRNVGCHEMRYLAAIYNRLYDKNEDYKDRLRYKAGHDALTGIYNREAFEEQKDNLRNKAAKVALLLVDVDEFKTINDTYGHEVGDEALKKVANALGRICEDKRYCLARIGGDEFAIMLQDMTLADFDKICEEVSTVNQMIGKEDSDLPPLSISVGAAFSEAGYSKRLFHQADLALYHTKQNGRKGCSLYAESMTG